MTFRSTSSQNTTFKKSIPDKRDYATYFHVAELPLGKPRWRGPEYNSSYTVKFRVIIHKSNAIKTQFSHIYKSPLIINVTKGVRRRWQISQYHRTKTTLWYILVHENKWKVWSLRWQTVQHATHCWLTTWPLVILNITKQEQSYGINKERQGHWTSSTKHTQWRERLRKENDNKT